VESQYDERLHGALVANFVTDIGIVARMFRAHSLWCLGRQEEAYALSKAAVEAAERLGHPLTMAFAYCFGSMVHQFMGTIGLIDTWTANGLSVSDAHGFRQWFAGASVLRFWLLATRDKNFEELGQLRESIESWRSCGATAASPYFDCLLGDALFRHGCFEEGLRILGSAQLQMDATGDREHEAELLRMRGEILSRRPDCRSEADSCFRHSLEIARSQEAKSWELRTATSLARLWAEQGRRSEARELLASVHGWFTEGFDTADLKEAAALLDAWA
jgi:adenylate cyclase